MGDGTEANPYTREDVLRLIEENGGTAEELDLSGKVFERRIDLKEFSLSGIILKEAFLENAHLEGADLTDAYLEGADLEYAYLGSAFLMGTHLKNADLFEANLENANLATAYLEGARLDNAHLRGAYLWSANLKRADLTYCDLRGPETNLVDVNLEGARLYGCDLSLANIEGIKWGFKYVVAEEHEFESERNKEEKSELLKEAVSIYRNLKKWHSEHGIYDVAGEFFFREMTVKRKQMKWWPKPWNRAWSKFLSLICGYGERPWQVAVSAAAVISVAALVYFLIGWVWQWGAFWGSLYFSAVSFTALGYGSWVGTTSDLIRGLGAAESFLGVFMIALFLVTFIRKMTR